MISTNRRNRQARGHLGYMMFLSRWLQAPLYLGLIIAQAIYVWQFMVELWHLVERVGHQPIRETDIMLGVLGLVDIVMIANLLIMVIVGGYETFVSRIPVEDHPDQPEWLDHVNANVLKVKLAMSIVGISSVHLLKTFIEAQTVGTQKLMWQTIIHVAFVLSALVLAIIDRIMLQPHGPGGPFPDDGHPHADGRRPGLQHANRAARAGAGVTDSAT
ncbi:MAG: TIGR00645 family protein [Streptosporangiales bacterium]|nr:TIGR00645 family protein [Streptosporangiales bacterium]